MSDRFNTAHASISKVERSSFKMPKRHITAFNVGELVPIHVQEVLPGDTFKVDTSLVARLTTPLKPTMDNLKLDYYYFFVPNRILWDNWIHFMGESKGAWYDSVDYQVPNFELKNDEGTFLVGTVADYFGIPTQYKINDMNISSINTLPFRAYKKIVNDWFRDQNLQDPYLERKGDSGFSDVFNNTGSLLKPFIAGKYHDYFTSCLPAPQKGPSVFIPFSDMNLPVVTGDSINDLDPNQLPTVMSKSANATDVSSKQYVVTDVAGSLSGLDSVADTTNPLRFANLWASSRSDDAVLGAPTINALRLAFAVQRIYEKDARAGSRYVEIIRSHFGVTSPDARQQRSEFLGGGSTPIGIQQVASTANTTDGSVGDVAAFSYTGHKKFNFNKSFTEHGFILGLAVARYKHTYSQGVQKFWTRKDRFDYYDTTMAHLGEQPVMLSEIYVNTTKESVDHVFGYQEAWADYRYNPSMVTGLMRPYVAGNLGIWHYADNYATQPTLSADWIQESKSNVDRTLALPSETAPQLIADIFLDITATRPMPLYSIPGMLDHF